MVKNEQEHLVVGGNYRFVYQVRNPIHGALGEGLQEFTYTGTCPALVGTCNVSTYVAIPFAAADKVSVRTRGRIYTTLNGAPPECDTLIRKVGNGFLYLPADVLIKGPAEITVFYGASKKVVTLGPRLIPVKPTTGGIKPLHQRPGFTFQIESLESQRLAIEASTDSQIWNPIGNTQANQFGEAEFISFLNEPL